MDRAQHLVGPERLATADDCDDGEEISRVRFVAISKAPDVLHNLVMMMIFISKRERWFVLKYRDATQTREVQSK